MFLLSIKRGTGQSASIPGHAIPAASKEKISSRCNNLVQNPSFEEGLTGWESNNAATTDNNPFEGTQVASLGPGVASLFQDVALASLSHRPLFLSFNVFPGGTNTANGNLIAEVLWLDADRNSIATGLRIFIPNQRITFARITYFDITDQPPAAAAWARLQFSKGLSGAENNDIIEIDQVLLTPAGTSNLSQNPSFEAGLTGWTATSFDLNFAVPLEGAAQVLTNTAGSTLFQDVPINSLPPHSSFLLAFGAAAMNIATLSVQVLWLNAAGGQIGMPGLDLSVPSNTLVGQQNYLTYLDITGPAPAGAVTARILFTPPEINAEADLRIDQVIFAGTATTNLVQNPSFEDGLSDWTAVNTTVEAVNNAYEGNEVARVSENGGILFQDVPLSNAAGHCFLFNCGIGNTSNPFPQGNMLMKILWLDASGSEIGLGLSLIDAIFSITDDQWLVYTGITEPAPSCTKTARIQFTKSAGGTGGTIDVDKVVLARLV